MAEQQSQALVVDKRVGVVRDLLAKSEKQISDALPQHIKPEYMIRVVMTSIQKTPALLACDQRSLIGSIIEASQLGLMPDGILGQAYLIPYKGVCQLQVGYRGYLELARRSGQVSFIASELVFECDTFDVEFGTERRLHHVPDFDNPQRGATDSRGALIVPLKGAYAIVKYKDGAVDFEYMSKVMLDQIKSTSKATGGSSPWQTHPLEMYRKCPIRRLAKRLPLSSDFMKAAVLDEYAEEGVLQHNEAHIDRNSELARAATENTMATLRETYVDAPAAEEGSQEYVENPPETEAPSEAQAQPSHHHEPYSPEEAAPSSSQGEGRGKKQDKGVPLNFK